MWKAAHTKPPTCHRQMALLQTKADGVASPSMSRQCIHDIRTMPNARLPLAYFTSAWQMVEPMTPVLPFPTSPKRQIGRCFRKRESRLCNRFVHSYKTFRRSPRSQGLPAHLLTTVSSIAFSLSRSILSNIRRWPNLRKPSCDAKRKICSCTVRQSPLPASML
jgi:hypothetical protein